ncbi:hypothetical protein FUA23_15520 [Neolewinella aurantiaca]|uniref:Lipoprotein n=1 Tax=Neolewinella aurantiaca TaxID=2602767 RepID=A0A5C7FBS6_9BACT|nr:hypothetical protein [Neolewinella aurantiaca]TXF88219.1 hypothetical protein FUA23_15520 [Neolewinella aurantiaca]
MTTKYFCPLILLLLSLSSCEKNKELTTLNDLRSEAVVWQLDASVQSISWDPSEVQPLHSERTLQFWQGKVYTNGSFCDLSGPAGAPEEIPYDAENSHFVVDSCPNDTVNYPYTHTFSVDLDRGELAVVYLTCVEYCALRYRRMEQ